MAALLVRKPGLLTTGQDLGRAGLGRFGVSASGAMDPLALRVANRLVGNPDGTAALEITAVGPELEFTGRACFALAGANLSPQLDGRALEVWRSVTATAGQVLSFGPRRQGARCYLAAAGGLALPRVFGSAATDLESGLGGGALRAGQEIGIGEAGDRPPRSVRPALLRLYAAPFELRFVPETASGPGHDAAQRLAAAPYRVSSRSNRMGYRLEGPPLAAGGDGGQLSEPIAPGTIQLPAGGEPILLMADRPTVGGYPRLGQVIAADLPKAGQLWIGHAVRFRPVTPEDARMALAAMAALLERAVAE